jgi:nucleoside-diphosphate-sugar epimerase
MDSIRKVLVVGGAGYVGCVLVPELLERGYAVKVFDRLYYGDQGLKGFQDRIELEVGDMRTLSPLTLKDVDVVINLGGLSNDPTAEYNPRANYEMNTSATIRLAQLCKEAGIKRYIFASSCSIYDVGEGNEERDVLLDETTPVDPKAAYSRSKYEAERMLLSLADDDFCPVILRKGTIYGFSPRMRYDLVVNTFVKDALDKGYMTVFYGGRCGVLSLIFVMSPRHISSASKPLRRKCMVRSSTWSIETSASRSWRCACGRGYERPGLMQKSAATIGIGACATTGSPAEKSNRCSTLSPRSLSRSLLLTW